MQQQFLPRNCSNSGSGVVEEGMKLDGMKLLFAIATFASPDIHPARQERRVAQLGVTSVQSESFFNLHETFLGEIVQGQVHSLQILFLGKQACKLGGNAVIQVALLQGQSAE